MQILIDTHILIWFLEGNNLLSNNRCQIIANSQNNVFVSIANLWEIAIKLSIGKLTLSKPFADVIKQIAKEDIEILSVLPSHTLQVTGLSYRTCLQLNKSHSFSAGIRTLSAQEKLNVLERTSNQPFFERFCVHSDKSVRVPSKLQTGFIKSSSISML